MSTSCGCEGKWLIPIVDERLGVQVKLWNPLWTRATPERFCGGDSLRRGAISSACTFTFITGHPGQLSLAIPLWVGALCTSKSWEGDRRTGRASRTTMMMSPSTSGCPTFLFAGPHDQFLQWSRAVLSESIKHKITTFVTVPLYAEQVIS